MGSEQAYVRFQINRLDREMHRLKAHMERLVIARGACTSSLQDNVERMIQRAQEEMDDIAKALIAHH